MDEVSGIILACAMCAMAHTFHKRRTEIWSVRRDGTWFSRMAHVIYHVRHFLEVVLKKEENLHGSECNLNCYVMDLYNSVYFLK